MQQSPNFKYEKYILLGKKIVLKIIRIIKRLIPFVFIKVIMGMVAFVKNYFYMKMVLKTTCTGLKPTVILQLDTFDKGGLEEVVLALGQYLNQNAEFNIYLFIVGNKIGYLGKQALQIIGTFKIITLNYNRKFLTQLLLHLKPKIVNTHYSTFGYEIYQKHQVKIVDVIHNNYIWLTNERDQFNVAVSDFIAVSSQVKSYYAKKFAVPLTKITAIPNGINITDIAIKSVNRSNYGYVATDFIFITVASFNYNKAHILSIAAFKKIIVKYPNARLLFIGNILNKRCYQQVIKMITDYKLTDKVKIINYVPKDVIYGLLQIADCFLLPSLIEGWSIALMEAMYMNLPLIASDIGSARDLITSPDTGIIIPNPYHDPLYLTERLIHTIYTDAVNYNNLDHLVNAMEAMIIKPLKSNIVSKNLLRNRVIQQYNVANMVIAYKNIFKSKINMTNYINTQIK